MKRFLAVLLMGTALAWASPQQASLLRVKTTHPPVHKHKAHKAGKHKAPKHKHHHAV